MKYLEIFVWLLPEKNNLKDGVEIKKVFLIEKMNPDWNDLYPELFEEL